MIRQLAGVVGYVMLFAFFLFVPAGTIHWRAGWILLAVTLVTRVASTLRLWSVQRELAVLRARLVPIQRGQEPADRVLVSTYMAAFAALVAFAARDLWHLHLLPVLPWWARALGLIVFVAGWWVAHLALASNRFAVTVVRYQAERGHAVADDGLYRVVRHPMYAGLVMITIGLCVWLGSAAALIAVIVPAGILAVRIVVEERMLRTRLAGYSEYASRVRWRLVPGVW